MYLFIYLCIYLFIYLLTYLLTYSFIYLFWFFYLLSTVVMTMATRSLQKNKSEFAMELISNRQHFIRTLIPLIHAQPLNMYTGIPSLIHQPVIQFSASLIYLFSHITQLHIVLIALDLFICWHTLVNTGQQFLFIYLHLLIPFTPAFVIICSY